MEFLDDVFIDGGVSIVGLNIEELKKVIHIVQFTVFTSVLDELMKKSIAREMLPVLKLTGIILRYDYHTNNPKNPDVRGVKKKEICDLFPNCGIYLNRITLAPPITRLTAPYSWIACYILEKLKIFNTHYLGIIKKRYRV